MEIGTKRRMINMEKNARSIIKSIIWRIVGVIVLASVTYYYTRQWLTTSLITFIHHGVFLFVFYAHERIWLKFKKPVNLTLRSIAKCITYETLLGNVILGTITYLITGNLKTMTAITISYISIKHIIYIINERLIWKYMKLGITK
jgi:uncharacterized membrane protein